MSVNVGTNIGDRSVADTETNEKVPTSQTQGFVASSSDLG